MLFTYALCFLLTLSSYASSRTLVGLSTNELEKRAIVDPPITSPTASSVWVVGNTFTVTWTLDGLPDISSITNSVGRVVLGAFSGDSIHLFIDAPLAQGFLISDLQVDVKVPAVPDGNYFIVLFGTSGNRSPIFKITNNPLSSILDGASSSTFAPSSSTIATRSSIATSASSSLTPSSASSAAGSVSITASSSVATNSDSGTPPSIALSFSFDSSSSAASSTVSPSTTPTGASGNSNAAVTSRRVPMLSALSCLASGIISMILFA